MITHLFLTGFVAGSGTCVLSPSVVSKLELEFSRAFAAFSSALARSPGIGNNDRDCVYETE